MLQDFFQISELNVDKDDFVQHQADQSLVTTAPLKRQLDIQDTSKA